VEQTTTRRTQSKILPLIPDRRNHISATGADSCLLDRGVFMKLAAVRKWTRVIHAIHTVPPLPPGLLVDLTSLFNVQTTFYQCPSFSFVLMKTHTMNSFFQNL